LKLLVANNLFSKYRLQALIFKIPAFNSPAYANLAVKYRPGRWNTGHLVTLTVNLS